MVDNSRVILENEKEYYVVDKIESDNNFYIYLSNIDDPKDFVARKEIEEDGKTFLVGLDDRDEASFALGLFIEKHQNV